MTTLSDLANRNSIDRDDVMAAIDEIASDAGTVWFVDRDRTDEEIGGPYDSYADAETFLEDEDYNPDRFTIREESKLDEGQQAELDELKRFDEECESDIPDWKYGVTIYAEDSIDGDYARERFEELGLPRGVDLDSAPYSFIDWEEYAEELKSDASSAGNYARLNDKSSYYYGGSTTFYYL